MLGYGLRRFLLEKRAHFTFPLLGLSAGGFERNHCCVLGFLWVDKAECENGSRCLAAKCMRDRVWLLWKGVESCTYLYVICPRVSRPHALSPRWVYEFVCGCMACVICLRCWSSFLEYIF
jgi:hypothetical protein